MCHTTYAGPRITHLSRSCLYLHYGSFCRPHQVDDRFAPLNLSAFFLHFRLVFLQPLSFLLVTLLSVVQLSFSSPFPLHFFCVPAYVICLSLSVAECLFPYLYGVRLSSLPNPINRAYLAL